MNFLKRGFKAAKTFVFGESIDPARAPVEPVHRKPDLAFPTFPRAKNRSPKSQPPLVTRRTKARTNTRTASTAVSP